MHCRTILAASLTVLVVAACGGQVQPDAPAPAASGAHPPAVTASDAEKVFGAFQWSTAPAVEIANADGTPTFYPAAFLLNDRTQLANLDALGVYHADAPFVGASAGLPPPDGTRAPTTTTRGLVRFAVIPGSVYMHLRAEAAHDILPFEGVVVGTADDPEANGSFRYSALARMGFPFTADALEAAESDDPPAPKPSVAPRVFYRGVRESMQLAAELAAEAARAWRKALGALDRDGVFGLFKQGAATLRLKVDVRNTDPGVGGVAGNDMLMTTTPAAPGAKFGTPIVRAWGASPRQQIDLVGVKIRVWQKNRFGTGTIFEGTTDAHGVVSARVAKNRTIQKICIEMRSEAAEVEAYFTPIEFCSSTASALALGGDWDGNLAVRHSYANVLAQAADSRAWTRDVVGFTPRRVSVLTGLFANSFSGNGALTPCLGFPNPSIDLLYSGVTGILGPIAIPIGATLATDIWIGETDARSRGVFTHEYGHYAMCGMLYDSNKAKVATTFTRTAFERITAGNKLTAKNDRSVNLEAFADFFAGQVVGATNYFKSQGASERYANDPTSMASMSVMYQPLTPVTPTTLVNLEFNATNKGNDADAAINRVASTLQDAFDGLPLAPARTNRIGDASYYVQSNPLTLSDQFGGADGGDEDVALPASALRTFVGKLDDLDDKSFQKALADTMYENGNSYCNVCRLYALHDEKLAANPTPQQFVDVCKAAPIANWIGTAGNITKCCPAGESPTPQGCGCDGGRPRSNGKCVAACPDGTRDIGGVCAEACAAGQLTYGNMCVDTCPAASPLVYNNTCVVACPIDYRPLNGVCEHIIL